MKLYTNAHSRGNTLLPLLKELDIENQVEIIQVEYKDLRQPGIFSIKPDGESPFSWWMVIQLFRKHLQFLLI